MFDMFEEIGIFGDVIMPEIEEQKTSKKAKTKNTEKKEQNKKKEEAINSIKEWIGKEILFPKNSVFTIRGTDTIDFALAASKYKVVSYIDTAGCTTCQLKLAEWQRFMEEADEASHTHTPFIFYLFPKGQCCREPGGCC